MARLYDRSFIIAFLGQGAFMLSNMLLAHYARWIDFLGGDAEDLGWILGVGAVAGFVLRPWMGQLIDRAGARVAWAVGYLIFGIGCLGSLALDELTWEVYCLRGCLVVGAALVFSSSLTYVTQRYPVERRTETIGILGSSGLVAMMIGPYVGDVILGATRSKEDFVWLFGAAAGILVVPAILICFMRPRETRHPPTPLGLREFVRTAARFWPGMILLVNVTFGMCMSIPFAFLSDYVDTAGLSISWMSEVGLFFLGYAGWALFLRVTFRRVPDRIGRRRVLLVGLVFMGSGMLCFLFVDPVYPFLLVLPGLVCGTGHSLLAPTTASLALDTFPDAIRGTGSSLSVMMSDLGLVAGAPILGAVVATYGYDAVFVAVGTVCFVTAALYAWSSLPVWRARRVDSTATR